MNTRSEERERHIIARAPHPRLVSPVLDLDLGHDADLVVHVVEEPSAGGRDERAAVVVDQPRGRKDERVLGADGSGLVYVIGHVL